MSDINSDPMPQPSKPLDLEMDWNATALKNELFWMRKELEDLRQVIFDNTVISARIAASLMTLAHELAENERCIHDNCKACKE